MEPLTQGGTGTHSLQEIQPRIYPEGYESGTLNTPGLAGLKAGIDYVQVHRNEIQHREQSLRSLFLREMTEEDFDALYKVLADTDIMQHYPYVFDENRVRDWIERNIKRYRILGFGLWALCLKETGEMIGDCG